MTDRKRVSVILDTDIGTDIDDTWALAMLLRSPELELRLVTTSTGDADYRARLVARLLEIAGRTDVPVGVGLPTKMDGKHRYQAPWVDGYDLRRYPGKVRADGVDALIEAVMASAEPVTIIAIGPLTTVAAALAREPRIADRARFVGMHGSIAWSPADDHRPIAEYNVTRDVPACRRVFAAPWPKTVTPLDTCGQVRLSGAKYRAVAESREPLARAVMENYRIWQHAGGWAKDVDASSVLFDCVAVYLAFSGELLEMHRLRLSVTDDGFTREDPAGVEIDVALGWKDLGAFEDLLVRRLTGRSMR